MKTTVPDGTKVKLNIGTLHENPENPRGDIQLASRSPGASLTALQELAGSMNDIGLLQPIIVREVEGGHMVVCGHRRLAAARYLGWETIPAIVRRLTLEEAREVALVENLQREDLEPLDEARAYSRLLEAGRSVAEIAAVVHRSRSTVAGRLALLDLPQVTLDALGAGEISMAAAGEIAKLPGQAQREAATAALVLAAQHEWDEETGDNETTTPCSFATARRIIHSRFMTYLIEASFDPSDADLVPAAGSCAACPRRTGNQVDLFGDLVATSRGADICTFPPCFESKVEAHAERLLNVAHEAGLATIPMTKALKMFSAHGSLIDNKYVDADSRARNPVTGTLLKQTWRKALGKKAPQEAVAVSPQGKAVSLYSRKAAEAVLKEKYRTPEGAPVAMAKAGSGQSDAQKHAKRRALLATRKVLSLMAPTDFDAQHDMMLEIFRISAPDLYDGRSYADEVWHDLRCDSPDDVEAYIANVDATVGDAGIVELYATVQLFDVIRRAFNGIREESMIGRIENLIGRSFVSILADVDREMGAEAVAGGES